MIEMGGFESSELSRQFYSEPFFSGWDENSLSVKESRWEEKISLMCDYMYYRGLKIQEIAQLLRPCLFWLSQYIFHTFWALATEGHQTPVYVSHL